MDASAEVSGLDAWFRRRVRQRPDAIALVYGGRHVSYAALDARVDSVARTLASRGVRAETPVGILLPAGIDQTICQLAVIRAGGSCLPLDPDAPDARIRLMLDDLDVRIAVSTAGDRARLGAVADCLADCPADYLTPGAEAAGSIAMPAAGLAHRTHVLYTSGTTGQPKGVEILARGIVRLAWQPRYVSLNADDRIAAIANPTFDAALFETWGALLNGGTVVFLPRQTCIDPATFRHSLRAQGVTTMFITSALFNHTVHACPDAFATLRTLLVGGEALNAQAICSLHRAANVAGTLHVLRFVASGRAKALHYVSSIAAFGPAGLLAPTKTLYEDDDLARHLPGLMFDMGYAASQWVADQLVTAAIRRGVPAAVYRPGFILGDSASGAGNRNDFVARLVRGCIAIGAYPHLPHQRKEIVPVDYVSAALLRIAADGSNLGRAYHLVPPREADQPDLLAFFGMLRACGYPLQSLPYADWLQRLADSADLAGNPLRPLLPLLTEPVYGRLTRWEVYEGMPRYDATHTARALAVAGGLAFPRLDRALMARYLDVWMGQRPVPDTR
ncbi:thioester reductase domain-containing protein [Cupriavidus sp. OV038]|uniref:AMP-binding protein n=1 Tax=unclassified Cupriavidus TaxID=2640874 RepID=UPI0008F2CD0B|nr:MULTISPECIES: AMP-binding protein [unclassified Cupriavidus]SFB95633.1 thioester reductase domain-containing protein [Cupriavidus sp. OV038]SFO94776.1 thioester reductase domain-containing protein [Cupriavidus sp. OV096]